MSDKDADSWLYLSMIDFIGINSPLRGDFKTSFNAKVTPYFNVLLPVGISFYGRAWSEPKLLEIAYAYEQNTKYRKSPKFLLTD